MSSETGVCLRGRTAVIRLRSEVDGTRYERICTVAFPARWTKRRFMQYVRSQHPDDQPKLLVWHPVPVMSEPPVWIANPDAFEDFLAGKLKRST